jgi:hypothetical protein
MTFDHVIDTRLQNILTTRSLEEDDICYALKVTADAISTDMQDSELNLTIVDARLAAYNDAYDQWHEEGNAERSMDSLVTYWTV